MSGFTTIDLSKIPAPAVIETPDFEVLFAEMKAEAVRVMPELASVLDLESEPAARVLRVCAYFRMLDRLAFNDGARACMLALATGNDLDALAAFWGVARLVVQPADDSLTPPVAAILETDDAFRTRVQLSLEGHTTAGPRGSYVFWAMSASGEVKDAAVSSPAPGQVLVSVLSHLDDGTPSADLLSAVERALNDEDVRPLTDQVTVQPATILAYEIEAVLTLYDGPDASAVEEAALAELGRYVDGHHRLGHDITLSGLYAALHRPGVQRVTLTKPAADVIVGSNEAAFCAAEAIAVSVGGRDV